MPVAQASKPGFFQRRSLTLNHGRISEESGHSSGSAKKGAGAGQVMEAAVRQSHAIQMLLDPDRGGRILECSVGACRTLGFSRQDLLTVRTAECNSTVQYSKVQYSTLLCGLERFNLTCL